MNAQAESYEQKIADKERAFAKLEQDMNRKNDALVKQLRDQIQTLTAEVHTMQSKDIDDAEEQRLRYEARINELDSIVQ